MSEVERTRGRKLRVRRSNQDSIDKLERASDRNLSFGRRANDKPQEKEIK